MTPGERSIRILLYLLSVQQTTFPELRERFNIGAKGLRGCLDTIEAAGLPLSRGRVYISITDEARAALAATR